MTKKRDSEKVIIVPCSGIGKTYGAVSREAAYIITEDLRPDITLLVALSKLVLGEETSRQDVSSNPVITIDGCKLACASKMVKVSGGKVIREVDVLDVYRGHREFRPQGVGMLNDGGLHLAKVLAEEVTRVIDSLAFQSDRGQNA